MLQAMNKFYILLILILLGGYVSAQRYQLPDSVETYGDAVKDIFIQTKDSTLIKTGSQFAALWYGTTLSGIQKDTVMAITREMQAKNYNLIPYLSDFYETLMVAVDSAKLSGKNLDDMLSMLLKTVQQYDRNRWGNVAKTLKQFFEKGAIYYANYNQVYAESKGYSFGFVAPQDVIAVAATSGEHEEEALIEEWGNPEESSEWEDVSETSEWNDSWGWEEEDKAGEEAVVPEKESSIMDYLVEETIQPELEGPVIYFDEVNLTFTTTFDSATLTDTKGALMLSDYIFVGEGGKFDWAMAGLSPDSVYCTLSKYNFDIRVPKLSAENGEMTYKGKVDKPVKGMFQFASQRHIDEQDARYPRFKSYNSNIKVNIFNKKEVNPNLVSYEGGFSLEGRKITSASFLEDKATIEVQDQTHRGDGQKKFKATSRRFNIGDSLITSQQASVVIFQRSDSIYHPAMEFKYMMDSSQLTVLLGDGNFKKIPIVSSYLNMDIRADMMRWDLRTDSINISTIAARDKVPVIFESHDYFDEDTFDDFSQMYNFHPLIMAVGYARKLNNSTFYADDLASSTGQNEKVIWAAMKDLMERGFIDYDLQTGQITLKRKAYHYVLSKAKRVDFDDIIMPSVESRLPNATLKLNDKELTVRGIDQFYLSDQLNVYIRPEDKTVTLLGDRNFRFNGTLYSGNFEFVGKNFTFNYDSFLVNLPQIDSISFYLADEQGNRRKVNNTLQSAEKNEAFNTNMGENLKQTAGILYINEPNNKSARRSYPQYPKFDAETGAIVYFDNEHVLDGAYDKSLYFVIPPFAIDSLNNADPASIGFKGTLYSDILPPIEETLLITPDNAMGFEHKVSEEGYALYGGTATFHNMLRLDAHGLRGNGTIDYLTSTFESQDFIFYTDSVITEGTVAEVRGDVLGQTSFPQAYVENYSMKWLPLKDSMYITNNKEPFQFYNQTASLDGEAIFTSQGLLGKGTLFTRGSEAISEEMTFKQQQFSAGHAEFEIKSSNPKKPALAGKDVHLDFNLEKNDASISPEIEGVAAIEFPYAQFKTSITKALWDMEEETVQMSKPEDVDIANSYFYATRKELDSLVFNAEEAIYRIPLLQLDIFGVPYIQVADAKITPENNQVQVLENATLETFNNATLVIDTLNEYHKLYKGTIDILSRNEFKGKATYELVSAADTFAIEMTDFHQEEVQEGKMITKHTVAKGEVQKSQNILISPGMLYKGLVNMNAQKEALELDGEVKLDFKRIPNYDTWISYKSEAGQKQLEFDFEQSVTDQGDPLVAGLHLSSQDNSLYTSFVTERRSPDDIDLFKPSGLLSYDEEKQEYSIRAPKKDEKGALSGKVFTYNENIQTVSFEGPVRLLPYSEQGIALEAATLGTGNLEKNEFTFDAFLAMSMDLPAQAVLMMGQDLDQALNKSGAPAANSDRTRLLYKVAEIIGEEAAKEYDRLSISDYTPLVSVSGKLVKTLVISDVTLQWSDEHKAWYNTNPLGISNMLEQDINAKITGFLEIKPTLDGTIVNLFMQATPDAWYYFSYQNNRMGIWAYNEDFCDLIGSKSKINKAGSDEFAFFLSDIAETLNYVNRFRKTYLGIEEPYNLDNTPAVIAGEEKKKEKEVDRDGF